LYRKIATQPLINFMRKRILVLDDDAATLDIVKEVLSYEKFEVKVTSDSDNFIEAVKTYRPHLLILDYKHHGPKGDELCRQVKNHKSLFDIPVIICSAYIRPDEILTCGCDAIIAKPFGLTELIEKVNGLVYCD
jgi:DNA-binding response OmpR family regulator